MHYVLLPGLHGSARLFDTFVAAAPQGAKFTRVAYPMAGAQDYDTLTRFAEAALPTDQDFVIVAESFSGPIGVRLSAKHPAGLVALVLVASFVRSPVPRVLAKAPRWVYRLLPMYNRLPRILLGGWAREGSFDKALREELEAVTRAVFYGRVRAILTVDERVALARVRVPVLYVRAGRDWVVAGRSGRIVKLARPEFALVEVEGPHLLAQVVPEQLWAAVEDFLATG